MQTEVNLICSYEQGNCGSVSEGMYVWKRKRGKAEAGSRDGARGHSQHQEKKSMINTHTHIHQIGWMEWRLHIKGGSSCGWRVLAVVFEEGVEAVCELLTHVGGVGGEVQRARA